MEKYRDILSGLMHYYTWTIFVVPARVMITDFFMNESAHSLVQYIVVLLTL